MLQGKQSDSIRELKLIAKIKTLVITVLAVASSCSTGISDTDTPHADSGTEEPFIDMEEARRQVRVQTLQRMLIEEDPQEVLDNLDQESSNTLRVTGVIKENGGSYSVETTRWEWDVNAEIGGESSISSVDSALATSMSTNDVTWCNESVSGSEFVTNYMLQYKEAFNTYEEYERSIADYVDCGTGEL